MSLLVMSCDTGCIPTMSCHCRSSHGTPGVFTLRHVIAGYVMRRQMNLQCFMSLLVLSFPGAARYASSRITESDFAGLTLLTATR